MITGMFSVLDTKTNAYMQPFFAVTAGAAIRSFSDAISDQTTMLHKHPEDFHLFHIGAFDDETGSITPMDPVALGNAAQYKEVPNENTRPI